MEAVYQPDSFSRRWIKLGLHSAEVAVCPTRDAKVIVGNKGLRFRLKVFLTGGLFRPHVPSKI